MATWQLAFLLCLALMATGFPVFTFDRPDDGTSLVDVFVDAAFRASDGAMVVAAAIQVVVDTVHVNFVQLSVCSGASLSNLL